MGHDSDTEQTAPVPYVLRRVAYEALANTASAAGPVLTHCPGCGLDLAAAQRAATSPGPEPVEVPEVPVTDPATRERMTRIVAQLLEVLDGRRPFAAAMAIATPTVARYLHAVAGAYRTPGRSSRALSVHVFQPHPDVAELAATCRIGHRARAVAVRCERAADGGWRVVVLRVLA